jgi:hypothetical protein
VLGSVRKDLLLRRIERFHDLPDDGCWINCVEGVFRLNRSTRRTRVMADSQLDEVAISAFVPEIDYMETAGQIEILLMKAKH